MLLRVLIILSIGLFVTVSANASEYVHGYTRSDGTHVSGYYRSSPDSTVQDNYSYKGNTNPYTGQVGDNRDSNSPSSAYYND